MKKITVLFPVALLMSGCAFSPVDRPTTAKHVPQEKVWQVQNKNTSLVLDGVRAALESAGYTTASVTPEIGELKTKAREVAIPEFCDCGTWNGGVIQGTAQSAWVATFKLQPNEEGVLKIGHSCSTTFMGRNMYGAVTTQETYACASRGQAEADVTQRIEAIFKARNIQIQ